MRTTKMILGLATIALLSTAAIAYPSGMNGGCDMKNKQHKMMKMHHKKGDHIIGAIMRLDLTSEQRSKIASILQKAQASQENPTDAFTAKDFNKEKFITLVKEQRDMRVEKKAQTIEKIYTLLNSTQKKNLKTMLDMQVLKRQQMMERFQSRGGNYNDQNRNGRG